MSSDLVKRLRMDIEPSEGDMEAAADRIEAQAARIAELEEELSIWRSVFPDIAPERVLPDRRLLLNRIAELEAALRQAKQHFVPDEPLKAFVEVCLALEGGKKDE